MWFSHCDREQAIYSNMNASHGVLEYVCVCGRERPRLRM